MRRAAGVATRIKRKPLDASEQMLEKCLLTELNESIYHKNI